MQICDRPNHVTLELGCALAKCFPLHLARCTILGAAAAVHRWRQTAVLGAATRFLIDKGWRFANPAPRFRPPSFTRAGEAPVCTNLAYSLVELTTLRARQSTCNSCGCVPASRALCSDARQPEARAYLQYEGRSALRWPLLDPRCVQQAKTRKVRLRNAKRQEETPRPASPLAPTPCFLCSPQAGAGECIAACQPARNRQGSRCRAH